MMTGPGIFTSDTDGTPAVHASGTGGAHGLDASSDSSRGVEATGGELGVYGETHYMVGVGVLGNNNTGEPGELITGVGVYGNCPNGTGVVGISGIGFGVRAESEDGVGVFASSGTEVAVQGEASADGGTFGVWGRGPNAGVVAFNTSNSNEAYLASNSCSAYLIGDVHIDGTLSKKGGGFLIDSPTNPAEMFLSHSFVESSERKNVYDGVVTVDDAGEAVVELPQWFQLLNTDFRYQLTPIGAPASDLHLAEEVENNQFRIGGAPPGSRVSWQVTGVRQDDWAKAHPFTVEEPKEGPERGHYLDPELYGCPREEGIGRIRHPISLPTERPPLPEVRA